MLSSLLRTPHAQNHFDAIKDLDYGKKDLDQFIKHIKELYLLVKDAHRDHDLSEANSIYGELLNAIRLCPKPIPEKYMELIQNILDDADELKRDMHEQEEQGRGQQRYNQQPYSKPVLT